jgi:hypothetical protein
MTMLRRAMIVAAMLGLPILLLGGCADWPHNETRQPASDTSMRAGQQKTEWRVNDAGAAPAPSSDQSGGMSR